MPTFLPLKHLLPSNRHAIDFAPTDYKSTKRSRDLEPLPFKHTRIGIEVEIENMPTAGKVLSLITALYWWKFSQDPSLRNAGLEFQSPGPLANEEAVGKALKELKEMLEEYKFGDFSFRTGIHVHLCLFKFALPEILNLFLAYNLVEPYLFEAFCPQRRFSNFCVPIGENGPESGKLSKVFRELLAAYKDNAYTFSWPSSLTYLWHNAPAPGGTHYYNKYSAINPSRIREIGTLEFRHLPGSNDFILLRDWISTITSLAEFSFSLDFDKFSAMLSKASTLEKVKLLFNKIIPKEIQKPVKEQVLLDGIRQAKLLLLGGKDVKINNEPIHVKKQGRLITVAEEILKLRQERLKNTF